METRTSMTRRKFTVMGMATLALGVGGALAHAQEGAGDSSNGLVTPGGYELAYAEDIPWDREADVIVVGCGGAGASAAIIAHDAGASVLVLEKGAISGGCTARCGQAIAVGGSDVQAALGIEDSPEDFAAYLKQAGQGDEELLEMLGLKSLETYEWLKGLGVETPAVEGTPGLTFGGNHDYPPEIPRTHWTTGIWPVLDKQLEERGIEVLTETPATGLIADALTGEIVGVVAGELRLKARRGVILSTGGFTNNPQMVHDHITTGTYVSFASLTDDGDGLRLGQSVGGGVAFLNSGNDCPAFVEPPAACRYFVESSPITNDPPYIGVNTAGKRFVNEYDFQVPINRAIMQQPGQKCYVIVAGEDGIAGLDETSSMQTSDSIAGIAELVGIDPDALTATVDEWNAACEAGADTAFGRTKVLKPLEGSVFAVAEVFPGFSSTQCGLLTDKDMHVLSALDRTPIARLFSAGNNSSILGSIYCTCGMAISGTITSGIIAGTNAVALDAWE